ncbi:MAG TPA: AgmX/PglI C-terminal domain-containing protein [Kofleriaceae bacterium]|nr:AgmX/PglI C-terminal domain-containing protein [Kofleriaceae bacterium]
MTASSVPPPVPGRTGEPGARAVEVAAMLGDSLIAVKHLTSPRGGAITRATVLALAGGGFLLALALAAFAVGVRHEAGNQRSLRAWIEDGRPLADWRPRRLGPAWDGLALGGAAGGLALLVLGASRARRERVSPTFRIGRAPGVDLPIDDAPSDSFELVAPRGDGFALFAGPGMEVERLGASAGRVSPPPEGIPLAGGARYRVTAGQGSFLVSPVAPPRRQAVPPLAAWEGRVIAAAAGSLLAHLGLVALLATVAPDARALGDDSLGNEGRLVHLRSAPRQEPPAPPPEPGLEGGGAAAEAGARAALAEGRMGTEQATAPTGRFQMQERAAEPRLARTAALARARRAGVLGELRPHVFASLTGTAEFSSGIDSLDVFGGLEGDLPRDAAGGWGYGVTGVGPGGGGDGWGTVGSSRFGRIAGGTCGGRPADCAGAWSGHGVGDAMARRKPFAPVVAMCGGGTGLRCAASGGDLDKNLVRRYIRRKLPAIRHCYERALVSQQDLAGTVVVQFRISPQGVVQGATATGLGHAGVESCVAGAIRAIQFPRVERGGFVNVLYPFVLQPAG